MRRAREGARRRRETNRNNEQGEREKNRGRASASFGPSARESVRNGTGSGDRFAAAPLANPRCRSPAHRDEGRRKEREGARPGKRVGTLEVGGNGRPVIRCFRLINGPAFFGDSRYRRTIAARDRVPERGGDGGLPLLRVRSSGPRRGREGDARVPRVSVRASFRVPGVIKCTATLSFNGEGGGDRDPPAAAFHFSATRPFLLSRTRTRLSDGRLIDWPATRSRAVLPLRAAPCAPLHDVTASSGSANFGRSHAG